MNRAEGELERKLDGYADFLRKRRPAQPRHQPHLVRWVREFLIFAAEHRGHTFEQTLALCLTTPGKRTGIKPWQIRQATDAVRIYRYRADAGEAGEEDAKKAWTGNECQSALNIDPLSARNIAPSWDARWRSSR